MNTPWAKTIKKHTNSTQNKSQTYRAKQYEVTSFLSTDCELSTETCAKNVYSLGPLMHVLQEMHNTDALEPNFTQHSSYHDLDHFNEAANRHPL